MGHDTIVAFVCNICNSPCRVATLDREVPSCAKCGSNVRFRWIVHALSMELFGRSVPLTQFPRDRKIRGISLSDWAPVANVLAGRFDYQNTFFDREPRLDIMNPAPASYDFIIASEVLEHVPPPVQTGFENLARLLKPDGFVIFSTPYESSGDTLEHFPDLFDWRIVNSRLLNRTKDGRLQTFENLVFHNGPGNTLETRVFSIDGLRANCQAAGLEITLAENDPAHGILWDDWSRGMVLRKIRE